MSPHKKNKIAAKAQPGIIRRLEYPMAVKIMVLDISCHLRRRYDFHTLVRDS